MPAQIKIARDLALPLEVAGEALAILATRGAGKSFTSAVLVEELFHAKVQFCVLDPTGVYWGLRAQADGKEAGLPIIVLGGVHGDVPLEPTAGKLVADLLVDTGQSLILDLSDFESKGSQNRFVIDLMERLYTRKARSRTTLHIVFDEAHEFAPQKPMGRDEPRMLGAVERVVGRGRSRGIGTTLISQRSATLNKNVLDLVDTLIAMRVLSPRDRKAIKDWIVVKEAQDTQGVVDSLPSMPTGTAWVWSPVRDILRRVHVRRIMTFDSYATPKPGQRRAEPRKLAVIDLDKLGQQIAATRERAKEQDPAELRRRIRELEASSRSPEIVKEIVKEEVSVLTDDDRRLIKNLIEALAALDAMKEVLDAATALQKALEKVQDSQTMIHAPRPRPPRTVRVPTAVPEVRDIIKDHGDPKLGKGERTVIAVLREWPDGRTYNELAFLSGYSAGASTLGVILAKLRKMGLVTEGQPIRLTPAGEAFAGGYQKLPTGQGLLDHWLGHRRMGQGERTVLGVLVENYPNDLTHDELCSLAGYSPEASTMGVILSKLRKLGLVEKRARRLDADFAASIGR